jgi:hypothetical protein
VGGASSSSQTGAADAARGDGEGFLGPPAVPVLRGHPGEPALVGVGAAAEGLAGEDLGDLLGDLGLVLVALPTPMAAGGRALPAGQNAVQQEEIGKSVDGRVDAQAARRNHMDSPTAPSVADRQSAGCSPASSGAACHWVWGVDVTSWTMSAGDQARVGQPTTSTQKPLGSRDDRRR